MVLGSLSTTDPSDINKTIAKAKESNIRISMVHLAAEVYVFKRICKETLGEFSVVMNEGHFRDLLFEFIPPPPVVREGDSRDGGPNQNAMVVMGFPTRVQGSVPTYCVCHYSLTLAGYQCPQCKSKVCEIPNDCDVCGLSLVASPHLARSYHHLFPIPTFIEQQQQQLPVGNSASSSGGGGAMDDGAVCFACLTRLADLQAETLSSSLDKQPNGGPGRDGGDQLPSGMF
ncbi:hypothetical protein EV182_001880 [Spiromyces aspiralis]|uniref:Uncharacterized protein n=1 Tax=Spiromyces aspiralis TaxID=68401 RepID=A0ACC1HSU7_9FUNG|nr:hypothetical protein EV182_001880 [Spiromyces aspiralis]